MSVKTAAGSCRGVPSILPQLKRVTPIPSSSEDMANLALARVFYATRQFPQAIRFYDKLPSESPDWLPSLFRVELGALPDRYQTTERLVTSTR